jgi:hypothetical protein
MPVAPEAINAARRAQARHGIPASVLLAQFGLESSWGKHEPPGSNNPFGEKALPGQPSVTVPTHEVVDGRSILIQAPFRVYASLDDAFDVHAAHLATSFHYAKARAALPDAEGFCRGLNGIYATDPNYADKLIALIRDDDLTRYDVPDPIAAPVAPPVVAQPLPPVPAPAQPVAVQTPPVTPVAEPVSVPKLADARQAALDNGRPGLAVLLMLAGFVVAALVWLVTLFRRPKAKAVSIPVVQTVPEKEIPMSILSQALSGKITWQQAASQAETWATQWVAKDPTATALAGTTLSIVKQGLSDAISAADTALAANKTNIAVATDTALEAELAAVTKGLSLPANAFITEGIDGFVNAAVSAAHAWGLQAKSALGSSTVGVGGGAGASGDGVAS